MNSLPKFNKTVPKVKQRQADSILLNEVELKGYNILVRSDMQFPTVDLSGSTSATETAEKGIKAKRLNVTMRIKYIDQTDLTALIKISEAVDDDGIRLIYDINNRMANAMGISKVKFAGILAVSESKKTDEFKVSFTLVERASQAERAEVKAEAIKEKERIEAKKAGETTDLAEQSRLTNGFERLMLKFEDFLGKQFADDEE